VSAKFFAGSRGGFGRRIVDETLPNYKLINEGTSLEREREWNAR
jgi:hypothetical protein